MSEVERDTKHDQRKFVSRVHITRDYFTFSAAHMALLQDGRFEPLHGHNYTVEVELEGGVDEAGYIVDFQILKKYVKSVTDELNHRVLIPRLSDCLSIREDQGSYLVTNQKGMSYKFPSKDVVLLSIRNTTTEELAGYVLEAILQRISNSEIDPMTMISVTVDESVGQGASAKWMNQK